MRRETRILGAVIAGIGIFFLAASVLCTLAIAHGASMQWRLLFRFVCHGIPHRCFTIEGVPMPICARCTAIYAGLVSAVPLFLIVHRWMREKVARVLLITASIAMLIDGLTQGIRLRESTNLLRLETGLAVGITFALWVLTSIETQRFTTS